MPDDPQSIGPYRTLRELGRGGQAIVWLAEDVRIQRQVALKVLPHLGPGAEQALLNFRREAEVASRLEHPGICGVLEADLDRGVPYIAMRYVAGETLAKRLATLRASNAPPPDRAELRALAHLFEKAARALHAAHEAGVIHRDVKPANIMVTPEGEPVILDFGLARHDDGTTHVMTITGEASGTPAYMSPEQMTGRSRPDRRTDVWSLGIALYECATLRHPFEAATREGLFQAILSEEPLDARRNNPAIDRDFATILETAAAKERDRRYQTALDFAEDLRRWRENEPVRARPVSKLEHARRWMQRNPALAASGAAIAVLLLAASALLFYGIGATGKAEIESRLRASAEEARVRAETERSRAETERERAEAERARAQAERERADAARLALEQVGADRRLSADLDEVAMQLGTLLFGPTDKKAAGSLVPAYLAAFERFGIDLTRPEGAEPATNRLTALRERDPRLWSDVRDGLRSLEELSRADSKSSESTRTSLLAIMKSLPDFGWLELERAERRWEEDRVDEFDALLTESSLAGKSAEELSDLAGALISIGDRDSYASSVLDRALQRDPSSFRLHFVAGALRMKSAAEVMRSDPESFRTRAAEVVHHMEVAVALRPRSGFARVMLANAMALSGRYPDSMRLIEEATELEPDNALVWLFKARFYGYTPRPDRGVEACKRALDLDPDLGGARELLAELEAKAKG